MCFPGVSISRGFESHTRFELSKYNLAGKCHRASEITSGRGPRGLKNGGAGGAGHARARAWERSVAVLPGIAKNLTREVLLERLTMTLLASTPCCWAHRRLSPSILEHRLISLLRLPPANPQPRFVALLVHESGASPLGYSALVVVEGANGFGRRHTRRSNGDRGFASPSTLGT